jgi:hypothetical protein
MRILAYETHVLIIRFTLTILEGNTFKKELHGLSKKKRHMFQDWKRLIRRLLIFLGEKGPATGLTTLLTLVLV